MKYKRKTPKDIRCPLDYALDIFGGKWKSRIICVMASHELMRYSDIKTALTNITDTVLAEMLKDLEKYGMVRRVAFYTLPPCVEYGLTEKGKSVVPILESINHWAVEHGGVEFMACENCHALISKTPL
jgi:DNA-binding HxlR family transcriptional regulator